MRQGLLDGIPDDVTITVLAAGTDFYALAARRRPGLTVLALAADPAGIPSISDASVIVDGLDRIADPAAVLRNVRRATSRTRVFALVSNGAYGADLLNFLAGDRSSLAHPMVADEVEELFAASGWQPVDRVPLIDRSIAHGPIPYAVSNRGVGFVVATAEIGERTSTAGYVIVADAQ